MARSDDGSGLNFFSQMHWPFSGSVIQDIHPSLLARAGDEETERRVLRDVASYGRQIGVLSDLLLALAQAIRPQLDADGQHALAQLQHLVDDVERIKARQNPLPTSPDDARALIRALQARFPELKNE